MSTVQITHQNFAEHLGKHGILVLDMWASWCAPCRMFAPIFEAASERHADVTWGKVDTESEPEIADALQVRAIPTVAVFRDGVLLAIQPGMLSAKGLDALVASVRALDMEALKKKIALADTQPSQ